MENTAQPSNQLAIMPVVVAVAKPSNLASYPSSGCVTHMGEKQLRPEEPPRFQSDSCASAIARSSLPPHTILVDHLGCVVFFFGKRSPGFSADRASLTGR